MIPMTDSIYFFGSNFSTNYKIYKKVETQMVVG
jgi:hypothetical protein